MFANDDDINPYLKQTVLTASPIRLRWLLINRAEELCELVQLHWKENDVEGGMQWLLRIREILGELLNGVTDSESSLGKTVADFYVYLIQLVTEVEQTQNVDRLGTLKELLDIEKETWRQVLLKTESAALGGAPIPPVHFEASTGDSFSFEA